MILIGYEWICLVGLKMSYQGVLGRQLCFNDLNLIQMNVSGGSCTDQHINHPPFAGPWQDTSKPKITTTTESLRFLSVFLRCAVLWVQYGIYFCFSLRFFSFSGMASKEIECLFYLNNNTTHFRVKNFFPSWSRVESKAKRRKGKQCQAKTASSMTL